MGIMIEIGILSMLLSYTDITPTEVHDRIEAGNIMLILDVREIQEYQNDGHIWTAANMPWSSRILNANYSLLPVDIDIIVLCKAGARSRSASEFLDSLGLTRIFNMVGGMNAWEWERYYGGYGHGGKGSWLIPGMEDTFKIIALTDSLSSISVPGQALTNEPLDSIYSELNITPLESLPDGINEDWILGFGLILYNPFGMDIFKGAGYDFAAELDFDFHYQWADEESIAVEYWDPLSGIWHNQPELIVDTLTDKVNFKNSTLYQFYALWARGGHSAVAYSRTPTKAILEQNYPNPFNEKTDIIYYLPFTSHISLEIYNPLGQKVETLVNKIEEPGIYTVSWNAKNFPGGVYFARLVLNGSTATKRMLVLNKGPSKTGRR